MEISSAKFMGLTAGGQGDQPGDITLLMRSGVTATLANQARDPTPPSAVLPSVPAVPVASPWTASVRQEPHQTRADQGKSRTSEHQPGLTGLC